MGDTASDTNGKKDYILDFAEKKKLTEKKGRGNPFLALISAIRAHFFLRSLPKAQRATYFQECIDEYKKEQEKAFRTEDALTVTAKSEIMHDKELAPKEKIKTLAQIALLDGVEVTCATKNGSIIKLSPGVRNTVSVCYGIPKDNEKGEKTITYEVLGGYVMAKGARFVIGENIDNVTKQIRKDGGLDKNFVQLESGIKVLDNIVVADGKHDKSDEIEADKNMEKDVEKEEEQDIEKGKEQPEPEKNTDGLGQPEEDPEMREARMQYEKATEIFKGEDNDVDMLCKFANLAFEAKDRTLMYTYAPDKVLTIHVQEKDYLDKNKAGISVQEVSFKLNDKEVFNRSTYAKEFKDGGEGLFSYEDSKSPIKLMIEKFPDEFKELSESREEMRQGHEEPEHEQENEPEANLDELIRDATDKVKEVQPAEPIVDQHIAYDDGNLVEETGNNEPAFSDNRNFDKQTENDSFNFDKDADGIEDPLEGKEEEHYTRNDDDGR